MCTGKSGKCPANKKECPKLYRLPTSSNSTTGVQQTTCGSALCSARDLQCQSQSTSDVKYITACAKDSSSCQLSCTDPKGTLSTSDSCVSFTTYFTDGTECGQGGICSNGACVGDKGAASFSRKNAVGLAVGGSCVTLLLCFLTIYCLRRKRRVYQEKGKKQDSYLMSENPGHGQKQRSNIRTGLDPLDNSPINPSPSKNALTRRVSASLQNANARATRPSGPYAPDSFLSEQEMILDLETDPNQLLTPSVST
ncbi:MAG: hypothetical protein J3Q66DRAFT_179172 [Benniella sp.]|nr:MAG: hypothetical protein J3Q66DRAFT_179172 [Benniella sp.]